MTTILAAIFVFGVFFGSIALGIGGIVLVRRRQ